MINPKIFYHPIDGSAPLSIYWFSGPKGDAVEADNGEGVGFFSPSQDMLAVIFDDFNEEDEQELSFSNGAKVKVKRKFEKIEIIECTNPGHLYSA